MDISDNDFINKYNELGSAEKMGKYFGCSSTAILNHAKKIGYNPNDNKQYKLSEEDKKNILEAYNTTSSSNLAI